MTSWTSELSLCVLDDSDSIWKKLSHCLVHIHILSVMLCPVILLLWQTPPQLKMLSCSINQRSNALFLKRIKSKRIFLDASAAFAPNLHIITSQCDWWTANQRFIVSTTGGSSCTAAPAPILLSAGYYMLL